jgi:hypothetical protein
MDTVNLKEFVRNLASLWNEHKKREELYMRVMRKENLGNLRRLCNQGHISALLFQKEILWIYDYYKCNLNDRDLRNYAIPKVQKESTLDQVEDMGVLLRVLKETEWSTIRRYQTVLNFVDGDTEIFTVLRDHIDRMSEFCDKFSNEIIVMSRRQNQRFGTGEFAAYQA